MNILSPRRRLLAVLHRAIPDCVPIFIRGVSPFGERMNWMGKFDESYERLRRLVRESTDIFHAVGFDAGVFLTAAAETSETVIRDDEDWRDIEFLIETPGGPIRSITRRSKHNLYEVMETEFFIKDKADFERFMSIPYVPVRPEVAPRMRAADAEIGDLGLPSVSMPSALNYAHMLLGSEGLAFWSVFEREALTRLLEVFRERILDYVSYLLTHNAGPVFACGGPELAVPPLMSPRDFHDFVTVIDRPVHELVHSRGAFTWIHCHGKIDRVLEEFLEIGTDILEPVEAPPGGDVSLADAKRRIGEKTILMGNIPYEAIISWPPGRIRERVRADCEAAMGAGGFIMMPCASPFEPVLTDSGFEGFKTYIQSGREFGRYG